MGLNVVLMGPPGSGKGTQAEVLVGSYGLWHVSTGNILRACVRDGLQLGDRRSQQGAPEGSFSFSRHIGAILKAGKLVPDDIMMDLIRETLGNRPAQTAGWLLDGFPRTAPQAEGLVSLVAKLGETPPVVVIVKVDDEEIVARLSGRLTCEKCGHPEGGAGAQEGDDCVKCGGSLLMREDDRPETIRNRLAVYREKTAPAREVLERNFRLERVDGIGTQAEVTERIAGVLEAGD